jgi:hypothetical protein
VKCLKRNYLFNKKTVEEFDKVIERMTILENKLFGSTLLFHQQYVRAKECVTGGNDFRSVFTNSRSEDEQ